MIYRRNGLQKIEPEYRRSADRALPVANQALLGNCVNIGRRSSRAPNLISLKDNQRTRNTCLTRTYRLHQTSGLGVMPFSQAFSDGSKTLFQYSRDRSIFGWIRRDDEKNPTCAPFRRVYRDPYKLVEHLPSPFPTRNPCLSPIRLEYPNFA